MHVLFLNHNVAWRGGFFRAYHWGRHLVRKGHRVTILTISESARWRRAASERDGVHLVKTPDWLTGRLRSGWDPWDAMSRLAYVMPRSFDLVHCVDSRPVCVLPALALKKLKGIKFVLDWGDWWGRGGTITERSMSRAERLFAPIETFFEEGFRTFADGSVVLTSALQQRAISLGVRPDSIVRIPHGADVEGITPIDRIHARSVLGIDAAVPILGYLGSILTRDADLLFRAFEGLRQRDQRIELHLIGNFNVRVPDHLAHAVKSTGPIRYDLLQMHMACCDVMLLPLTDSIANRGRWPSKISDYLAAGKPVVACRVGDVGPLLEDGRCGLLSRDTPEAFAARIADALGNPAQLRDMGQAARKIAETRLDWRVLTDQLEDFYGRVLAGTN